MASQIRYINNKELIKQSQLPLVIGYFGCIHVMHQQLLTAYDRFNVLTFKDFESKTNHQVYDFGDRLNNIKAFNPINIYVYDIVNNNMPAEQFMTKILAQIKPSKIIVGNDFEFGSDHKSWKYLQKYFKVETINYNKNVSTAKICELLKKGKVEDANDLLHCPYHYKSRWIGGEKKGRLLGARTINLLVERPLLIPEGSYASTITIGPKKFNSITFYGSSKTLNAPKVTLETHVLDKVIPPRFVMPSAVKDKVKIEFLKYIRPNQNLLEEKKLSEAIKNDIATAKEYFEHNI